jgi:hypothetical protein
MGAAHEVGRHQGDRVRAPLAGEEERGHVGRVMQVWLFPV